MKKLISLLLVVGLCAALFVACGASTDAPTTEPVQTTTAAPTEEETEAPSTKVTYTVTVKDQNGNPVEGAAVQMCDDKGCKMPAPTNAEGVVTFTYDPSNYHITIVECPEGYTCDPEQAFYFEGEATELTVEITKN